jgi:hypothetical protein
MYSVGGSKKQRIRTCNERDFFTGGNREKSNEGK